MLLYKLKNHTIETFFFKYQSSKNYINFVLDIMGKFECDLKESNNEEMELGLDIDMKRSYIEFK